MSNTYKGIVSKQFIKNRNRLASSLPGSNRKWRADFEIAECIVSEQNDEYVKSKGKDKFYFDVNHPTHKRTDFKYVRNDGSVYLGWHPIKHLGKMIDTIQLWRYVKRPMPMDTVLKAGDKVEVELVDCIPANEVKQQLNENGGNTYEYK